MNMQRLVLVGILVVLFIVSMGLVGYDHFISGKPIGTVLLNILLLSVPLVLLYFGIGLIVQALQQHRSGGVSESMAKFLYRTPRIAGILMAVFIGLFALDVFETPGSIWMKIGAFLIHAAPSIIILVLLALAWRWEWIGALAFGLAAALIFATTVLPSSFYSLGNLILFVLPMVVVAVLFWMDWRWRGEMRIFRL